MRDFEEKQMERWDNTSGYNYNDRGLALSAAFPALMRKVYTWMTLALAITAITAYGVASSPALLGLIYSSKFTFFGLIIAELALVIYVSARIDRLSLGGRSVTGIISAATHPDYITGDGALEIQPKGTILLFR